MPRTARYSVTVGELAGVLVKAGERRSTLPRWPILNCVVERMWYQNFDVSLVIRTDFAHPQEWIEIQEAIAEPQTDEGFTAFVTFVDDHAYDGTTSAQLLETVPAGVHQAVAFLVDAKTLTHPDRPILAVNLYDYVEDLKDQGKGPQYGATFRVVPSEMWSVQNNLTISNMDWEEFADNVDIDGVFRGFE